MPPAKTSLDLPPRGQVPAGSDAPNPSVATKTPPPGRRSLSTALIWIVLILALLAAFVTYEIVEMPLRVAHAGAAKVELWAGHVRDAFVAVAGIQPRVTEHEQVVFEQSKSILELAVMARPTTVEREFESTWMGSTKRLRVRGLYQIKAGFDLSRPFGLTVDGPAAEVVRVQLPAPRIVGVELNKLEVLTMENGLWNHLTREEMEVEVNALGLAARQKAWDDGVPAEAQRMFIAELQTKLGEGHRLEVSTPTPPVKPLP